MLAKPSVTCISGPSGAGKSSVARALSERCQTYVEDASDNPYLNALISDANNFDAGANQAWFLERVGGFITHADTAECLLIDQDPVAIVKAYAKMFCDEEQLTTAEYG